MKSAISLHWNDKKTFFLFILLSSSCAIEEIKSVNTWGLEVNQTKENLDQHLDRISEELSRIRSNPRGFNTLRFNKYREISSSGKIVSGMVKLITSLR